MTARAVFRNGLVLLLPLLAWMALNGTARADGEAGLVVDFGNGVVETYCIDIPGSEISGEQMLRAAGLGVNQFSGLVCSIDSTGCTHSGSFDSCTCECKSGGSDCTYWAFFSQKYGGKWTYSATGFQLIRAKDGDLQAWKWGKGSLSNAPPPASTTFEQVCGHAPGSVAEPTPTMSFFPPTATPDPANPRPTIAPATSTSVAPNTPIVTFTQPVSTVPPGSTAGLTTPAPPASGSAEGDTPTSSSTVAGTSESPTRPPLLPPQSGGPAGSADEPAADESGSNTSLIAFGAVAAVLVAGIGAAVWKGRRS